MVAPPQGVFALANRSADMELRERREVSRLHRDEEQAIYEEVMLIDERCAKEEREEAARQRLNERKREREQAEDARKASPAARRQVKLPGGLAAARASEKVRSRMSTRAAAACSGWRRLPSKGGGASEVIANERPRARVPPRSASSSSPLSARTPRRHYRYVATLLDPSGSPAAGVAPIRASTAPDFIHARKRIKQAAPRRHQRRRARRRGNRRRLRRIDVWAAVRLGLRGPPRSGCRVAPHRVAP